MTWLTANIGTILVLIFVAALVTGIIYSMVKDKRTGKTGCGHGCSSCAMHGQCHKANAK